VSLLKVESEKGKVVGREIPREEIEIKVANIEFEKGSCIAVNVCDIIYAGLNAEIKEEEIEIELPSDAALTVSK
jgi:hypothetical protein